MPRVCILSSQHLLGAKRVPRGLRRATTEMTRTPAAGIHPSILPLGPRLSQVMVPAVSVERLVTIRLIQCGIDVILERGGDAG